jgi:alpha-ketoglutarate-dependent 2,4-dichlorophenoxyacetate dioxygenase
MSLSIRPLTPRFAAEVVDLDLRRPLEPHTVEALVEAIDTFAVLVYRGQALQDDDQLRFSNYFGTTQKSVTLLRKDHHRRLQRDDLSDISNVDEHGDRINVGYAMKIFTLSSRLWHTDNSFRRPSGKYTFLCAKRLPPEGGNTEFADMRAAWDALSPERQAQLAPLRAVHNLGYSRVLAGSPDLDENERAGLPPTPQDLVRLHPGSGRRSLYLASHAEYIEGMPRDAGRALLDELTTFSTRPSFVYAHVWQPGDLVMWDNRCTMHRAMPFDEQRHVREMRRSTVAEDMPRTLAT